MRRPRFFLNSILGVVVAAGCSQAPSTAPSESVAQVRVLPPLSAFSVRPMPSSGSGEWGTQSYTTCSAMKPDKESRYIGVSGGSLDIGPHTLFVPPGALLKSTKITAEIVADSVNSVRFSPEGLQFQTSVYLFLEYDNCASSVADQLQIVYTSDDLGAVLEQLPSFNDKQHKTVVGLIKHFSRYAVAY